MEAVLTIAQATGAVRAIGAAAILMATALALALVATWVDLALLQAHRLAARAHLSVAVGGAAGGAKHMPMRDTLMRWPLVVIVAGLLGSFAAQAQVLRCTDAATGKVTYTDGKCAPGTSVKEVERRKTDEELAEERARTDLALRRRAEQRAQDLEQQRLDAQQQALQAEARRRATPTIIYPPAEPQAQRDPASMVAIDGYGYGYGYGYRPHIRPPHPPAPPGPAPSIVQCDVFKCTDTDGHSHPRPGIGEGPPPGKNPPGRVICRSRGGTAPC